MPPVQVQIFHCDNRSTTPCLSRGGGWRSSILHTRTAAAETDRMGKHKHKSKKIKTERSATSSGFKELKVNLLVSLQPAALASVETGIDKYLSNYLMRYGTQVTRWVVTGAAGAMGRAVSLGVRVY